MQAAWHMLRNPQQSLSHLKPKRPGRSSVPRGTRLFSVMNTQDFNDLLSKVQEKARQLREAAVSRPFKWPNPGWANPSWPSPREIQIPKFDLEPDIEEGGAIAEAVRADSLGFGFSAGGMLFPYYIGVLEGLKGLGLATDKTHLAGASAGSIIAVCHHSGLATDVIAAACLELAADCRRNGTRGRLGVVLEKFLHRLLPDDIHERCRGRSFIAVTRAFPRPKGELISQCTSKDDLIDTLLTSCHIPWWFDSSLTTTYRGAQYYDGGLTNFIPVPPDLKAGVRVCCFPSKQINSVYTIQISPDSFEDWPYTMREMLGWAFEPADDEVLVQFISKGRADAEAWALKSGAAAALKEVGTAKANLEQEDYPALKS